MSYCPYSYKWQLVDWAVEYKSFRRSTANNMTKRQLYAIWYKSQKARFYERMNHLKSFWIEEGIIHILRHLWRGVWTAIGFIIIMKIYYPSLY